ncbi:MAG: hypothetical protein J5896_04925 [Alphaproteobacteria bacterium]|nr:hypothetical protein [Alphaproteobacteria bacterium]
MPQLNPSSFVSQIFWLTITFLFLWAVMSRFIIPRIAEIIDERQKKIAEDIQKAERTNKQAQLSLERYESFMNQAKKQTDERILNQKQELEASIELKKAEIAQSLGRQIAENEALIKKEREETLKVVHQISQQTADLILQKLGFNNNDKA